MPAHALTYQERLAALERRKEMLAESRTQAETSEEGGGSEPTSTSYLDKMASQFSLKIEQPPSDISSEPNKDPVSPPKPPAESPGVAPANPFNFFSPPEPLMFEDPKPPSEKATEQKVIPSPALPVPAKGDVPKAPPEELKPLESNPFAFLKERAPPPPESVLTPAPAPKPAPIAETRAPTTVAPAPGKASNPSQPWWERVDEISAAPKMSEQINKVEVAPVSAKKPAPLGNVEKSASKAPEQKSSPAADVNVAEPKGKSRKSSGFKLVGAQMLLMGSYFGLAYLVLFKAEQIGAIKASVNKVLLSVGSRGARGD